MKGTLLENVSLADYTSWRAGGVARHLYKPVDLDDLSNFLTHLPEGEPLLWLGLGSNTLVRDGGFKGTVIVTQGALQALTLLSDDDMCPPHTVRVEAGVACATMARQCARMSLKKVEFLAGVPGTMGGALRMNAGCFNGETWDTVCAVETINTRGDIRVRQSDEFDIGYRSVTGLAPDEWFVAGYFVLEPGDKQTSLDIIRELLARRSATQPTGEHNCGSVFRNPEGDYAARLIEHTGLKGYVIGDAMVSDKHANFIINRGQASAKDIEALIEHVVTEVERQQGIALQREVHIVGEY